MATEYRRMMQLRGDASLWASNDIILLTAEIGFLVDPGGWRMKAGDGVSAFSALPFIGENDPTARAGVTALEGSVLTLDTRVTALETAGGDLPALQAQVDALTLVVNGKQDTLPTGTGLGDYLIWDPDAGGVGVGGYVSTALTLVQGSLQYWDVVTETYLATPLATEGQQLTADADGNPVWTDPPEVLLDEATVGGNPALRASVSGVLSGYAVRSATLVNGEKHPTNLEVIFTDAAGDAWVSAVTVSDPRLKTNITPLPDFHSCLEQIGQISLVSFDWLPIAGGHHREVGFTTDNLKAIAPEMVSQSGTYESIDMVALCARLVGAVQTLSSQVLTLTRDLAETKHRMAEGSGALVGAAVRRAQEQLAFDFRRRS